MSQTETAPLLPPPLAPGQVVGVVAPGRWPEPAWLEAATRFFNTAGWEVVIHPQCHERAGQLAGTPESRAAALMDMFRDSRVGAIVGARGGTGSGHLLDRLDYDMARAHPKRFVGFSDITVLLQALTQQAGFVTFHGPMAWNLGQPDTTPRTGAELLESLTAVTLPSRLYEGVDVARSGKAEGRLVVGNMALLQTLIGTRFDWSGQGTILVLEDVDEPLYKLDRTLAHFRRAGKFDGVQAVLFGEMVGLTDGETGADLSLDNPFGQMFREIAATHVPAAVPLAFGLPCGHGATLSTLPFGATARVRVATGRVDMTLAAAA